VANPPSIRLLVAEDVPQVSQHVRNLLSVQAQVKLLEVLSDGSKIVEAAHQLRPDVVLVDLLLQGKMKGPQLIEKLRDSGLEIPVVVLTVPQHPLDPDPEPGELDGRELERPGRAGRSLIGHRDDDGDPTPIVDDDLEVVIAEGLAAGGFRPTVDPMAAAVGHPAELLVVLVEEGTRWQAW